MIESKPKFIFIFVFLFLFLLSFILLKRNQVNRFPSRLEWKYSDLRLLDPVDADSPYDDIVAIYLKHSGRDNLNLRIDFLNLSPESKNSIVVAVDCRRGVKFVVEDSLFYIPWDYQLWLSLSGAVRVIGRDGEDVSGIRYWVSRDMRTSQFYLGISLCEQIDNPIKRLQVAIVSPRDKLLDVTDPFYFDGPPPSKVKLVPVFWNFFSASTPAQALRSWDGAHAGKDSGRHGLRYLIDAVRNSRIPVNLVWCGDFRDFAMLGLVDVGGLFEEVVGLGLFRFVCGGHDYTQFYDKISDDASWITSASDLNDLGKQLFNASDSKILFIGGNFKESIFGDAESYSLFRYLNEQKWLEPIRDNVSLVYNKNLCAQFSPFGFGDWSYFSCCSAFMAMRNKSKAAQFTNPALEALTQLHLSSNNPYESIPNEVRQEYLRFSDSFLWASHWISDSFNSITCTDQECIVASNSFYSIINKEGGYMSLLFSRLSNGSFQIIGPTFQLTALRGDISTWNITRGIKADPKQILGAFYNKEDLSVYEHRNGQNEVVLYNPSTNEIKKFSFFENEIQFTAEGKSPQILNIPLILNPWIMKQKDWKKLYEQERNGHIFRWKLRNMVTVEIITTATWSANTFIDSLDVMTLPEDPNYPYPAGHYLPVPLAQVDIECPEKCTITIRIHTP